MIPIYLFNASPWGSLTKGYRLLNPSSQREMREKNPYHVQRWRVFLSLCIIHASWSPPTANTRIVANTRAHIFKGPRTLPCILKNAEGAILFPFAAEPRARPCKRFASPNVLGCICTRLYWLFYCINPKRELGGGGKTKTKQRDVASGLGIFLLPRKGCAINNRGRKQPGGAQRQNCSTSCWMKTWRGTPRVVNKEFPAALLAIQKAKVERVTVLCQQVGGGKKLPLQENIWGQLLPAPGEYTTIIHDVEAVNPKLSQKYEVPWVRTSSLPITTLLLQFSRSSHSLSFHFFLAEGNGIFKRPKVNPQPGS